MEENQNLCSDCQYKPATDNGLCQKCIGIRERLKKKPNIAYHNLLRQRGEKNRGVVEVDDKFMCNLSHRFQHRAAKLKRLGFKTYQQYVASDLWASIRQRVIERDECLCQSCKRPGCEVHHMDYDMDTLEGKSLDRLVLLCFHCHRQIEKQRKQALGRRKCRVSRPR